MLCATRARTHTPCTTMRMRTPHAWGDLQKTSKAPTSQAAKKLAKVDKKGMKSMMSFFGASKKKAKK